jgi:hypothetical protein
MDNNKLGKLVTWITEIKHSCEKLKIKSYFYAEYLKIVKFNKDISSPPIFHEWVANNYYESALMNIRRLLDDHRDVISLNNLLSELRETPELITKEWYLSDIKDNDTVNGLPSTRDFGNDYFNKHYSDDNTTISRAKIEDDLAEIYKLRLRVERYIDNCLAHQNEGKKGKQGISTKLIEDVINDVEKITIKYLDLFKVCHLTTLLPTFQYDWQSIFYKPWIKSKTYESI